MVIHGLNIKIIEHRIAVLSIDESTRIQPHGYDYCEKEYERILWSFYNYSPEENFSFNNKPFYIL